MSNQYIIQFKTSSDDEFTYGYAKLSKSNYDIPVLCINTCEDNMDPMNQTLFNHFITSNFCDLDYSDEEMECTMYCPSINYIIKFDKNSSSAFTEFKNQLSTLLNSKFETKYYPGGNVLYVGHVMHVEEDETTTKTEPNGEGILYYDLPNHMIKYIGEFENGTPDGAGVFYDKTGKIKLVANNISNGIPTQKGKLEFCYKLHKQIINIDFFKLWNELDVYNNTEKVSLVMSDTFLETLVTNNCDFIDTTFEEICFNEKTLDEKLFEIWDQLQQVESNYDEKYRSVKNFNENLYFLLFTLGGGILLDIMLRIIR